MRFLLLALSICLLCFCENKSHTNTNSADEHLVRIISDLEMNSIVSVEESSEILHSAISLEVRNKEDYNEYITYLKDCLNNKQKPLTVEKLKEGNKGIDTLTAAQLTKKIEETKHKFIYEYDEFDKIGRYFHKLVGNPRALTRNAITCTVYSDGDIWLTSVYASSSAIFHEKIKILIDTTLHDLKGERSKNSYSNGQTYEYTRYHEGVEHVIGAISENAGKPIKIRFEGTEIYDDAILAQPDKDCLKDCLLLSKLLKASKKQKASTSEAQK